MAILILADPLSDEPPLADITFKHHYFKEYHLPHFGHIADEFKHLPPDIKISELAEILSTPKSIPVIHYHRSNVMALLVEKGIDARHILTKSLRNLS